VKLKNSEAYKKSDILALRKSQSLSDLAWIGIPKCSLKIKLTTILKAVCLRQDLRSEIGSGYFLMHTPWTSLFLLEVMESNADTHKVSHHNWIENYRGIKNDSEWRWSQWKGHKLSQSRVYHTVFNNQCNL